MIAVIEPDLVTLTEAIASTPGITLVDFTAEWCPPCRAIAPVLAQLESETEDLTVLKIDADAAWDVTGSYRVMSFPTLVFFVAGQEVHRLMGSRGIASLREALEQVRQSAAALES